MIEYELLKGLVKATNSDVFYRTVERTLSKARSAAKKQQILDVNDRIVKELDLDPKAHRHLTHR